jgi:putative hemolysin
MADLSSLGFSLLLFSAIGLCGAVFLYLSSIASSIALARSRTGVLEELQEEGHYGASRAQLMVAEADYYLICAQFGRVLASLATGLFLAVGSYAGASRIYGMPTGGFFGAWAILAVFLYVAAVVVLLVAVQVVKSVTLQHPEQVLCKAGFLLRGYALLFGPVIVRADRLIGRVLTRWDIEASNERELRITAADLGDMVKVSSEAGTLESEEGQILEGVAELSERTARDSMTPRSDIVWVKESASSKEVLDVFRKESVSRLLVCSGELDDVRGVLLAKDLLVFAGEGIEPGAWRRFIRPVYRVPDTKVVKQLLVELKEKRVHFAVVLNEHGEVVGVVTLEDLVEEIVGEIFDEFDQPQRESLQVWETHGTLFVDGGVAIQVLADQYDFVLPDGEYQTVGGFVHEHLGRVPVAGDSFSVAGITCAILEVQKRRIVKMSLSKCVDYRPEAVKGVAIGVA